MDILIITYEQMQRLVLKLSHYEFWRIVLDEVQHLSNRFSVKAQAVAGLARRHSWAVTGKQLLPFAFRTPARTEARQRHHCMQVQLSEFLTACRPSLRQS